MSLFQKGVVSLLYYDMKDAVTNLFAGIHRSESASVTRLPTLSSNILYLFMRSVVEITGVGIIGHSNIECLNIQMNFAR